MLRNPNLNKNPNSLAGIPSDWDFWKNLDLEHVRTILATPLLGIDGVTALPEHRDLTVLINNALKRVDNCATEAMLRDCIKFAREDVRVGGQPKAEAFMQLKAILSFYNGDVKESAKYAGILGDIYFIGHRLEADFMSSHFNRIAGIEYERLGNVSKACHHYNQYLAPLVKAHHTPEEFYSATKYLLKHNQLVMSQDTITELNRMKEKRCSIGLVMKYSKLIAEVKLLPISDAAQKRDYYDLNVDKAKLSLAHSIKEDLAEEVVVLAALAKYRAEKDKAPAQAQSPAPSAPPAPANIYLVTPRHGRP